MQRYRSKWKKMRKSTKSTIGSNTMGRQDFELGWLAGTNRSVCYGNVGAGALGPCDLTVNFALFVLVPVAEFGTNVKICSPALYCKGYKIRYALT